MKVIRFPNSPFELHQPFEAAGDQPQAIKELVEGIEDGLTAQTLLGVTGSGKTYTMANVIARTGLPTLIMAPNKTLAAQLYAEMRDFFPNNAVEYFVSYYDYYQPEAYVPQRDLFIEKDSAINEHIEQMRLSASKSVLERRDVIIVATVSAIYGIGKPESYTEMRLILKVGDKIEQRDLISHLVRIQYERNDMEFTRGKFRVRGDTIDVFPAEHSEMALRIELFDDEIEAMYFFDPLTGKTRQKVDRFAIYPTSNYVTPRNDILRAIEAIKDELRDQETKFIESGKLLEAQRIRERTLFDLEMLHEVGFCKGIENYSRVLSGREPGSAPFTLIDYFPEDFVLFVDESHVTLPQVRAMYNGDRARKTTLVDYGFRLPSAYDNRPLTFDEFTDRIHQAIYVSATPAEYERSRAGQIAEQVIRPTGLLDPEVFVRPIEGQIDDLIGEINATTDKGERTLVTTLTKKMAEDLTKYLTENGIRVRYMHSDIGAMERMEIIRDLRMAKFDVLVGINLLREGLDLPEVSLIAILDADKEGFLRSETSLIQTIGRAARNAQGRVLLYADKITPAMRAAMDETARRRQIQDAYNKAHGIVPKTIVKSIRDLIEISASPTPEHKGKGGVKMTRQELAREIEKLEAQMRKAAHMMEYEYAAVLRDEIIRLRTEADKK